MSVNNGAAPSSIDRVRIFVMSMGTCGCRYSDGESGKMVRDEEMEAGRDE